MLHSVDRRSRDPPLIILQEHDNTKQGELRGIKDTLEKTRPFNGNSLMAVRKHSAELE